MGRVRGYRETVTTHNLSNQKAVIRSNRLLPFKSLLSQPLLFLPHQALPTPALLSRPQASCLLQASPYRQSAFCCMLYGPA